MGGYYIRAKAPPCPLHQPHRALDAMIATRGGEYFKSGGVGGGGGGGDRKNLKSCLVISHKS